MKRLALILMLAAMVAAASAQSCRVRLETTMGNIVVELNDDTPLHSRNFEKLVRQGFYDGVLFHRVINKFMIQAGDPTSVTADSAAMLGEHDAGYTIAPEILVPKHYHKRGALAAARANDAENPGRRSSSSQFYIVTGRVYDDEGLAKACGRIDGWNHDAAVRLLQHESDSLGIGATAEQVEAAAQVRTALNRYEFSPEQTRDYTTTGGAAHLDSMYTVFGYVVEGMEVAEAIQLVATDENDRPLSNVRIVRATVVE